MPVSGHLGDRWLRHKVKAAGDANITVVKAAPGTLKLILLTNMHSAAQFIKFYDMAVPPAATDTPAFTLMLPITGGLVEIPSLAFEVGIAYRITALVAENDATAATADGVTGVLGYV